jgi:homoserine O-acetyltransferase
MRQTRVFIVILVLTITALCISSAQALDLKPEYYVVKDFKLVSGEVLPQMKVEYAVYGTPKKDASGQITNAVVFCHGWSGNYNQINIMKGVVGPGKSVDPERFFYIFPTALGSPGSSCPSVSGMGPDFPKYTIVDMIAAQYLLVKNHLKIDHLAGVMGASMGGCQTLQWITDHPEMMDWAIPIATGPAFVGRNVGVFGLMSELVRSDPAYQNGHYQVQPKAGMRLAFLSTYLFYFTPEFFASKFKSPAQMMKGLENAGLGSEKMDANDIIWRNDAMMDFDVRAKLPMVKAKTMVIGVNSDELFPPEDEFRPVAYGIPGAKLFAYDSVFGHLGCALDAGKADNAMLNFINSCSEK